MIGIIKGLWRVRGDKYYIQSRKFKDILQTREAFTWRLKDG